MTGRPLFYRRFTVLPYDPSCAIRCPVIDVAGRNTGGWITCVDNPAAADADGYVVDVAVFRVEDQISGSCARYADLFTHASLFARCTGKADSELTEDGLRESRTVRTVCQARTAIYIRIADKLQCVRGDG